MFAIPFIVRVYGFKKKVGRPDDPFKGQIVTFYLVLNERIFYISVRFCHLS